jgi:hypothetical protein
LLVDNASGAGRDRPGHPAKRDDYKGESNQASLKIH